MSRINTIGILTSGGDAPGMNAAIRAVTRAAIYNGWRVKGIYRGWEGLINNEIKDFTSESVSGTINRGGTILRTARSKDFMGEEGRAKAYENIKANGIDALVVIGGNGSLAGAQVIAAEYDIPCVGLPGTIDNDLYGTDTTIGYDTALNTIMECVDKIRDTASSHERLFIVEVMGRDAGFLALNGTIATGAEACVLPEIDPEFERINQFIANGLRRTKSSSIVLFAEGREKDYNIMEVAEGMRQKFPELDVRVSILGYLQRGGSPTANDRILASRLGVAAVDALLEGQRNVMVGLKNNEIVYIPFTKAIKDDKPLDKDTVRAQEILAS
jgi:6-phosphofructokinase 1